MSTYVEVVAETPFAEFEKKLRGRPIVIIYPRHRGRNALVAMFLQHYQENVVYYSLTPGDTSLKAWLQHMVKNAMFPEEFGGQTRAALAAKGSPEDLAEALGADLAALRSDSYMLLLDSFDILKPDKTTDRFFRALADALPGHVRVVISARLLDLQPWNDLLHAGSVGVVGNEEALGGGIYGEDPALGQLEVLALSGGHVYIDGRPVTSWDGSLPRHLFYFFVYHPMVTRDQIFEVFWPHMSVKEATNVFHVTKRRLHKALDFDVLVHEGGYYRVNPDVSIYYDIMAFVGALVKGRSPETEDKPAVWQEAIDLYRGPFLQGHSDDWIVQRRSDYQTGYLEALSEMARIRLEEGRQENALGLLLRAVSENDRYEPIHRQIMQLYANLGRRSEAAAHYQKLVEKLKSDAKEPDVETKELYAAIMS